MFTRGLKTALAICIRDSCVRQVLSQNLLEPYADQMETEASYATDFILPALKGCSMYLQIHTMCTISHTYWQTAQLQKQQKKLHKKRPLAPGN